MRYKLLTVLFLLITSCIRQSWGQEIPRMEAPSFLPPFDFPITFAGNFGEIRANHFHGGLDFKTGGSTGKQVRALADGYISRIRVTHGSGYMLDVVYHNGYTTINRHLSAFTGAVAQRAEALQYEQQSWEIDIIPEPGEYPVKAGQVIALSGNTGYSFGPHLHLDIMESDTRDFIDPLPFFMRRVKDHTPPRAEGIMLFPQAGRGVVEGQQIPKAFPLNMQKPVTAWGVIGSGIRAYDYMDDVHNKYGVKTVILEVDGQEVFRSVVDRFSAEENRYINSWTHGQYMKSFIEPGNRLRMLQATGSLRGLVDINEERPYKFAYTLVDALGNTSHVNFIVQGKRSEIPSTEYREKYFFRWDRVNILQEPGLQLIVPRGMLYDDVRLNYSVHADSGDVAFTYRLHDTPVPMHGTTELHIGLRHHSVADSTKYYVAAIRANGRRYSVGGHYRDGAMHAAIRELTTYTVAIDTVPPRITPINPTRWGRNGRIVLKASDPETGISHYHGTIDGEYALFGIPNSINGNLVCELRPEHVRKGGRHLMEITVTDGCGNRTTEHYSFVW